MNDRSEPDLNEPRTRRAMLATAGGLLLPAGLLALDGEDAEATKRAKRRRRRRRKQVGWFGNDVIINFRNATSETLQVTYLTNLPEVNPYFTVEPGKESGFAAGVKPSHLTMAMWLWIRFPGLDYNSYRVRGKNFEAATPLANITWYPEDVGAAFGHDISGLVQMGEDTTFNVAHRGYRFNIHRWRNGKEPLDDYDEWYTRFFVTLSEA
jgi:hypothetical protein